MARHFPKTKTAPLASVSRERAAFLKTRSPGDESPSGMRAYTGRVGFWQGLSDRKLHDRETTAIPAAAERPALPVFRRAVEPEKWFPLFLTALPARSGLRFDRKSSHKKARQLLGAPGLFAFSFAP